MLAQRTGDTLHGTRRTLEDAEPRPPDDFEPESLRTLRARVRETTDLKSLAPRAVIFS